MFARQAPAALLALIGCAGGGDAARRDMDALRAEIRALRRDHDDLSRELAEISARMDLVSARLARAPEREEPASAPRPAPVIPSDLAVVRIEPGEARPARTPPPVPTAIPIAPPDAVRMEGLARRGGRDLGSEAEAELRRARGRRGPERARALEEFAARYPRHPSADNALVEAAAALAEAGLGEPACDLARRACDEYPAGDAMSDALERLAWCESRRGARDAEREILERIVSDYPRTPAAGRAGARLATLSGRAGEAPGAPPRSGP